MVEGITPGRRAARRAVGIEPLAEERVALAKRAFSVRHVPTVAMQTLIRGSVRPLSGDLVLARIDRLGHHAKLELASGRKATMHVGDEVIVAYADRYAPDQFEANVPASLKPAHLVASGGIASEMITRSADAKRPTDITPIGLVGDAEGLPVNVDEYALPPIDRPARRPHTIAVVGTSMNSGKTTTCHWLVHALARAGYKPGATKVTGTGSGGDYWVMLDAGAHMMLDFTDGGLASTYRVDISVVERRALRLIDHLAVGGCGAVLVEVADGVFQRETARLLTSEAFRERIDGFIFAGADALGAVAGVERLRSMGLPVVGVSGRFTRSPLAVREAQSVLNVPVYTLEQLSDPAIASALFGLAPVAAAEALEAEVFDLDAARESATHHHAPLEVSAAVLAASPEGSGLAEHVV